MMSPVFTLNLTMAGSFLIILGKSANTAWCSFRRADFSASGTLTCLGTSRCLVKSILGLMRSGPDGTFNSPDGFGVDKGRSHLFLNPRPLDSFRRKPHKLVICVVLDFIKVKRSTKLSYRPRNINALAGTFVFPTDWGVDKGLSRLFSNPGRGLTASGRLCARRLVESY